MSNRNQNRTGLAVYRSLMMLLFGFGILVMSGCESPSDACCLASGFWS
jgi:hypothetical protein